MAPCPLNGVIAWAASPSSVTREKKCAPLATSRCRPRTGSAARSYSGVPHTYRRAAAGCSARAYGLQGTGLRGAAHGVAWRGASGCRVAGQQRHTEAAAVAASICGTGACHAAVRRTAWLGWGLVLL